MIPLELLAPARDKTVGIAAIDCGADAVYIAGPSWGNRYAAGNALEDVQELCGYARRFGVRIYLTVNTLIRDDEWDDVHAMMLSAQEVGVDAFIVREERLLGFDDIKVPMYASTQCSIRTAEAARRLEEAGYSRLILERGISMEQLRQIRSAVGCELEFFVHGALCVCYSGECRLSEYLDGRSADRGECIQACRSLYDLVDASGKVLVRNKALLSLKDFNLVERLSDLAEAGVSSFKIEGRLKNESYVRNVVRAYSRALDALVAADPDKYCRASFGKVHGGFEPDLDKTFNRGYTTWWLDGRRDKWSSMDAPKSMGEFVGTVESVKPSADGLRVVLRPASARLALANGDGFAFVDGSAVRGFRGDRCEGLAIFCKKVDGLRPGVRLFRNIDASFEREIDARLPRREVSVDLRVSVHGSFVIEIEAVTEDGRRCVSTFNADVEKAENRERAEAMLREQLGKRCEQYSFSVSFVDAPGALPLLSASTINSMRRCVAGDIPDRQLTPADIPTGDVADAPPPTSGPFPLQAEGGNVSRRNIRSRTLPILKSPLMRTRYCIRYELNMCPKYQGAKATGPLFLVNNGRRLALGFDCAACEMTVDKA
ncbi:MAG: U32 family peptidase [Bacteroidales bacterium]|nr:U32 family peptidase [Bacteroidales bacterium]